MKIRMVFAMAVLGVVATSAVAHAGGDDTEGKWRAVSTIVGGKPDTSKAATTTVLETHSGKYKVFQNGKLIDTGTYKVDLHAHPQTLDIYSKNGPGGGAPFLGIRKMKGKHFVECLAMPGKPRPTSFESSAKSMTFLIEYERAGK